MKEPDFDRDKFLKDDIPYRAGILKAGIASWDGKYEILNVDIRNACFVACAITVRQLIEFFGLTTKPANKNGEWKLVEMKSKWKTDVLSENKNLVPGSSIKLVELETTDLKETLRRAHLTGSQAAAHFTFYNEPQQEADENAQAVKEAAEYLLDQLQQRIYTPLNMEMPNSWSPYKL